MKSFKFTKLLISLLTTTGFANANQFCNKMNHSGQSVTETQYKVGKIGGANYELWFNGGSNSATFYSDGSMKCSFQNTLNYICRSGLSFDSTKSYNQIGHLYADYNYIEKDAKNIEFSYIGVYGWTKNPLVEFLIIENWIGDKRPTNLGQNYGDFMINGEEYTIYKNERTSDTIVGYSKYQSYSSVRKTKRNCGTVDITAHFRQWNKIGLFLGKLHETKVFAQVGSNQSASGTVDFPYAMVYIKNKSDINSITMMNTTTQTPNVSYDLPTSSVVEEAPTDVPTKSDTVENIYSNEEATTTKEEVTTTSEAILETSDPNITTSYDIKKEKDMKFIKEAETIEPLETYIIPESIPITSTIVSQEFYLLPVLNEKYKDNELFKDDEDEEDVVEPMAMEQMAVNEAVESKPKVQEKSQPIADPKPKSLAEPGKENCVPLYGQCGGQNYNGATCCKEGKCTVMNPWYSQCI